MRGNKNLELIFIKTVKQPSSELSNMFANIVVRDPHDSKKLF